MSWARNDEQERVQEVKFVSPWTPSARPMDAQCPYAIVTRTRLNTDIGEHVAIQVLLSHSYWLRCARK